jgi:ATP-dependent DNA helicase RecG
MANAKGGRIVIGVSKSGKVTGIEIGKDTVERLSNKIVNNMEPKVYPKISVSNIGRENVIVIEVKEAISKPILAFGRPFKRVGKSTMRISKDEYERMILEKKEIYWDGQICEETNLKDIDWKFVGEFFIPLYEKVSRKKLVGTPKELLESLRCIRNGRPTNGGILLFGRNPQKFFLNSYIAAARYKGNAEGTERLDYREFEGNLFMQIDETDKYIKEHAAIMSRLLPYRVEREDIPEYGFFSIRELVTNAVCHRDYSNQHTKVIIKMFSDRIGFYNPGSLPEEITPQNITEKQFSRNPVIAKVLAKVKFIEELGEGWNKIIKEHKEHPLKPKMPKIKADKTSVLVTLFSSKEKFEIGVEFSDRQIKAIDYVKSYGKITNHEYKNINRVTKKTATRDLQDLAGRGVLLRVGRTGKGVHYILNPNFKGDIRGHKGTL